MPELPKSVIARLKAQAAPPDHPDADLLAAFAEQALTGRERESVLAHLAACQTCRETVTLAAPQSPALQPAAIIVPWYRRPQIFAWAGTLATVALVGALILNYARSGDRNFVVSDATPAKVAKRQVEAKPEAPADPGSATARPGVAMRVEPMREDARHKGEREQRKNKPGEEQAVRNVAPAPATRQAPAKDEKKMDGGVLQNQYSIMNEAAPPPSPATPAARAGNAVSDKQQAAVEADAVSAEAAAAPAKSTDAALAGAAGGSISQSKVAKLAAAPARWSISEKGRLQRSLDSGHTWQPQLAKEETVFRAVAVIGSDVWAGGSGAALFHSADGGTTWTRQALPGASADIVLLQFTDAQHGTARTADGITWTTTDGGLHWARQ